MISNFLSFIAGRTDELTGGGIKRRSRFKAHKAAFCVDDRKRGCTEALANVRHQLAGAGISADQVLAEFHGLLRGMNAARHCRHKKQISSFPLAGAGWAGRCSRLGVACSAGAVSCTCTDFIGSLTFGAFPSLRGGGHGGPQPISPISGFQSHPLPLSADEGAASSAPLYQRTTVFLRELPTPTFRAFLLFNFCADLLSLLHHKLIDFVKGHNPIARLGYDKPGLFLLELMHWDLFGYGDRLGDFRGNILRRTRVEFSSAVYDPPFR